MKGLGDEYVRAEFRRHKGASEEFLPVFLSEWESYLASLRQQTASFGQQTGAIGAEIPSETIGAMTDEQKQQLLNLREETRRPIEE